MSQCVFQGLLKVESKPRNKWRNNDDVSRVKRGIKPHCIVLFSSLSSWRRNVVEVHGQGGSGLLISVKSLRSKSRPCRLAGLTRIEKINQSTSTVCSVSVSYAEQWQVPNHRRVNEISRKNTSRLRGIDTISIPWSSFVRMALRLCY